MNNSYASFKYFTFGKKIEYKNGKKIDEGYCITKSDDKNSISLYEKILHKYSFSEVNVSIDKRKLGKKLGYAYLGKIEDTLNNEFYIFLRYSVAAHKDLGERYFIQCDYILINYNDFKDMDFDSFQIFNHYFQFFDDPEITINKKKSRSEKELLSLIEDYLPYDFIKTLYASIYSDKQITILWDKELPEVEECLTAIIMLLFPSNIRPLITFSTYTKKESTGSIKLKVFFQEEYLDDHIVIDFNKRKRIGIDDTIIRYPKLYSDESLDLIDIIEKNKLINKYLPEVKAEIDLKRNNKDLIETIDLAWELVSIEIENNDKAILEKYHELLEKNNKSMALNKTFMIQKLLKYINGLTSISEQNLLLNILEQLSFLLMPKNKEYFINSFMKIFDNVNNKDLVFSIQLFDFYSNILTKHNISDRSSLLDILLKLTERKIPISLLDKFNSLLSQYSDEDENNIRSNIIKNISFNDDKLNEQDIPKIFNIIRSLKDIELFKNNILSNEMNSDEYCLISINSYIVIINSLYSYVIDNNNIIIHEINTINKFNYHIHCFENFNNNIETNEHKNRLLNWICIFINYNIQMFNKSKLKEKIEQIIEELAIYLIDKKEFKITLLKKLLENNNILISNNIKSKLLYLIARKELFKSLNDFETKWEEVVRIEKESCENYTSSLFDKLYDFIEITQSKPSITNFILPYIHEQLINNIDVKNLDNFLEEYFNKLNELSIKNSKLPVLLHSNIENEAYERKIFLYLLKHIFSNDKNMEEKLAIIPLLFFEISNKEYIKKKFQNIFIETIDQTWKNDSHLERDVICKIGELLFQDPISSFFKQLSDNKLKVSSKVKVKDKINMLNDFINFINNQDFIMTSLKKIDDRKIAKKRKQDLIEVLNKLVKTLWPKDKTIFSRGKNPLKNKFEDTIEKLKNYNII